MNKKILKKLKSLEREMGRKEAQNDIEDEMVVFRTHIQSHTVNEHGRKEINEVTVKSAYIGVNCPFYSHHSIF